MRGDERWLVVEDPAGHRIGVPLAFVHRVETLSGLTTVPLAPESVLGIAEVGGRVVTVIEPRPAEPAEDPAARSPSSGAVMPEAALLLSGRFANIAVGVPAGSRISTTHGAGAGTTRLDEARLARLAGADPPDRDAEEST